MTKNRLILRMSIKQILQLLLLAAIWGSSYLFMKMVAPSVGVLFTIASRIIIAAILLVLLAYLVKQLPSFRVNGKNYLVLGILNLALPFALITWSVIHLNASMSAILNATTPLFTLLMARIWLREKLTAAKITGILLGIVGIVVLVGWSPVPLTLLAVLAMGASILAAVSYGMGNVYARIKMGNNPPMQTASGQLLTASGILIPLLLIHPPATRLTPALIWPILALGIVCTAAGYTLYFRLISTAGSVKTSMVTILVPVFSIIWSVMFLKETVTLQMLAGLLLIMTGLLIVTNMFPLTGLVQKLYKGNTFKHNNEGRGPA